MSNGYDDMDDRYEDDDRRAGRTRTALVVILVLLFLMLIGLGYFISRVVTPTGKPSGGTSTPVGLEWIRSLYGYGPKSSEMFLRPIGTAIGPDGTVYGTDPQRSRVLAFTADGTFKAVLDTGVKGSKASRSDRVAVDEDGNLYVADGGTQLIRVFTPSGTLLREWFVPIPTGVAVRGERVYVATPYGIAVCDTKGNLIATWGRRGGGPEEFDNPHGIAIADDGTVYVADTLNGRIKAYTPAGRLKWIWPKDRENTKKQGVRPSTTETQLQIPTGLCIDGRGRLVLVDPFAFQIVVVQPSATTARVVGRYGASGSDDGFFTYPDGISYDPARDWFAVADTNNNRVQIVRIPGSTSNVVGAALRRAATGPTWICVIPLILLLAAIVVAVARRRARRARYEASEADDGAVGEGADDRAE